MKKILSFAILTSLMSPLVYADFMAPEAGTVRVTVVDANGNAVPDAPVYIYGEHRTHFVGGADIPGSTTFNMKEGSYRISSAMIKKTGEYVDRYASNEAHVRVVAGDNVSVVLTLNSIKNPDEPEALSYATMHVAGIPAGLLNN